MFIWLSSPVWKVKPSLSVLRLLEDPSAKFEIVGDMDISYGISMLSYRGVRPCDCIRVVT
jgi:hypothetical protein